VNGALLERLEQRLKLQHLLQATPAIAEQPIEKPVFVVGLPRTGTTLLHNLLCQDQQARPVEVWEANHPTSARSGIRDRILYGPGLTQCMLFAAYQAAPGLRKVHAIQTAHSPEECTMLLMTSLTTFLYSMFGRIETYSQWCLQRNSDWLRGAYEIHRQQLQMLQWQTNIGHWVLKSPAHLACLEALLTVYPTAQVIVTERDPAETLPSNCSLFATVRETFSQQVDRQALGKEVVQMLAKIVEHSKPAREQFRDRMSVVRYEELVRSPIETVRQVYERFGRTVDAGMEQRIQRWLRDNPQNKHGAHKYSAAEFGIDLDEWRARFPEQTAGNP
jgi:hypothetical protein